MEMEQMNRQEENEIDLIEVVRKLWKRRKFILKVTAVFMCLGILVALFSAKVYTASCTMVPQTGSQPSSGGLGGLAALAGINLGSMGNEEVLSPKIYPKILASVPFQKELMQTRIKFEEYEQPVSLLEYYTEEEYRKFSIGGAIVKYTVGLPGVIMKAIRGEEPDEVPVKVKDSSIQTLSRKEHECIKVLEKLITLTVNDKDGYITLSADMPDAGAAAQVAARVQELLQHYVTEFKIEKVQNTLKFIEERYAEAKKQFEQKQADLASFRDANRNFGSAIAKTNEERLSNEYTVALNVYSELAKQREQANIQVKENTPIFAVVEPVTVPIERSKPKRGLICVAFTFLGGFLGVGLVLMLPFLVQASGWKRLQNWLPEPEHTV